MVVSAMAFLTHFLLILLTVSISAFAEPSASPRVWKQIDSDLEMLELPLSSRGVLTSQLVLFRTSLTKYRIGVVRASEWGWKRSTVKRLVQSSNATLGLNANFFDERGDPLGLLIARGAQLQKLRKSGSVLTGVFGVTRSEPFIVNRSDFTSEHVVEAVQAGPRILAGGVPIAGIRESLAPSKRSGVCIDSKKRVIFYITRTDFFGLDIAELQTALLREEIGCRDALNLDGGGSAQLYVSSHDGAPSRKELAIQGSDEVPVILALFGNSER